MNLGALQTKIILAALTFGAGDTVFATQIRFEFEGVWEEAEGRENPSHPLNQFVGTNFSGFIEIPTDLIDLEPSPNIGRYEISPEEGIFALDMIGDEFDVINTDTIYVSVFNDATADQVFGGAPGAPYYDSIRIGVGSGDFAVSLDAAIKSGNAPTAFHSDRIPLPEEILATASIGLNYVPLGVFESDDLWLSSYQPLPALFPPGSLNDNLDITITSSPRVQVPIPEYVTLLLMFIFHMKVRSYFNSSATNRESSSLQSNAL